jgi:hypothetical protein
MRLKVGTALLLLPTLVTCRSLPPARSPQAIAAREYTDVVPVGGATALLGQQRERNDPHLSDWWRAAEPDSARTLEDVLFAVKDHHPHVFRAYALLYDSLSLHDASFSRPRALVFGASARTIVTFNQCGPDVAPEKRASCGALEMVEFDPNRGPEFREMQSVAETAPEDRLKPDEIDVRLSNARFLVSKANPGKCATCHGSPARWNWDGYSLWAGAYGSQHDLAFHDVTLFSRRHHGPRREVEALKDFMAHPCGRGGPERCRYAVLGPLARIGSSCRDVFGDRPTCERRDANQNYPKPNDYLTYALMRMNAQDIVRRELADPRVARDVVCLLSTKGSNAERTLDARVVAGRRAWVRRLLIQNGLTRIRRQRTFTPLEVGTLRGSVDDYDRFLAAWRADAPSDASPLEFEEALATTFANSAQLARVEAYLNRRQSSLTNWSMTLYREPEFRDGLAQIDTITQEIMAVTHVETSECGGAPDSSYNVN